MAKITGIVNGVSPVGYNSIYNSWTKGLSAYDLAVAYNGYSGTIKEWLESLKGTSVTVKAIEDIPDGKKIILEDANGEYEVLLDNHGISITGAEINEEGTVIAFSDGTVTTIPKGDTGPVGEPGAKIVLEEEDGVIYQNYEGEDAESKEEVFDFKNMMSEVFNEEFSKYQFVEVVDELPSPEDANPYIIYVLREEV